MKDIRTASHSLCVPPRDEYIMLQYIYVTYKIFRDSEIAFRYYIILPML